MPHADAFPTAEVQFTRDGQVHDEAEAARAVALVGGDRLDDLVVFSHGWNNDMDEARTLYRAFFAHLRSLLDEAGDDRRIGVLAVLWPSKKFAERDLIPSGAASVDALADDDTLREQAAELADAAGDSSTDLVARVDALLPHLEDDPAARRELADAVRALLPRRSVEEEDASEDLFAIDGAELMDRLGAVVLPAPQAVLGSTGGVVDVTDDAATGAVGHAQGLGDVLAGPRQAARRLLNFATYYLMKDRAALVGTRGLLRVLRDVRAADPDVRIHLVGHSFGARVVTSAAAAWDGRPFASALLLQAAFSHNGFAQRWNGRTDGAFRPVLTGGRIAGPVAITHTVNDRAVGLAYPIASRIARQNAAGLGDRSDPYGGLGRNGAVHTPEATDGFLLPVGARYSLTPGAVHNLLADDFVRDHGDVATPETAYALLSLMTRSSTPVP